MTESETTGTDTSGTETTETTGAGTAETAGTGTTGAETTRTETAGKPPRLLRPLRTRPWPERWLTRVLGAALSAAAYLACIPWDPRNRAAAPGAVNETSPVTAAGVAALAAVLLLLAAYFGHRDRFPAVPLLLVAVPPSALLYVSLRAHPPVEPDGLTGLWPLAWGFFTFLIAGGVLVGGAVGRALRPPDPEEAEEGVFSAGRW
jgi:hypothetical protein